MGQPATRGAHGRGKAVQHPKRVVWKAFKRVKANQGSAGVDKQSSGVDLGTEVVSANVIYLATIWAIPVIIAITFHEAAHGFVAHLLGDDTAWRLGRVSLNPLKHVDPFGTILLPGFLLLVQSPFLFGYAKPVPGDRDIANGAVHHCRDARWHERRDGRSCRDDRCNEGRTILTESKDYGYWPAESATW